MYHLACSIKLFHLACHNKKGLQTPRSAIQCREKLEGTKSLVPLVP